ncbi:MAG: NAD-dependent malic enzyme [Gemmatimonadales bacterium]
MTRPIDYIHDPRLNKGTAFTQAEREALGLRGLLPPRVVSPEDQASRIMENFRRKSSPLEQYIYLISLQDRNEHLFYRVVIDHIEEMLPIIYTPTVGEACLQFGHIFRRPRGLYLCPEDLGRVTEILRHWPEHEVGIIVVTDGERILGLGDLGANGMGIPIGKLSLYTACAGVNPALCLPLTLDTGTERAELHTDPLYLGRPVPRIRGAAYDALVEEMVRGVQEVFPGAMIQFEDFATANALTLLDRYKDQVCCFNDDIQGTAAVTLAGLLSACRVTGQALSEQRVIFFGAGAAGTGIATLLVEAKMAMGMTRAEAERTIALVDREGLVTTADRDIPVHRRPFAQALPPAPDLLSAVEAFRPTALVGVSGSAGAFSEPVLRALAGINRRPIIFPLSNPTSCSECTADQAFAWTDGRAVFASGSPFGPVVVNGRKVTPSQSNNAYIFPGVGLGVMLSRARRVTSAMFLEAARALAALATDATLAEGRLFSPLREIRDVSAAIAVAVMEVAYRDGLATRARPADLAGFVRANMYDAHYPEYR